MIKILIISSDQTLNNFTSKETDNSKYNYITYSSTTDVLDIMSQVCSNHPSILILDDDFVSPHSVHLLESIKKVNPKLSVIFTTSNTSIELGRKIHSIGVKFYMIKPFSEANFKEFLKSIEKEESNLIY